MIFLFILVNVKVGFCCCDIIRSNNTLEGTIVEEQFNDAQENVIFNDNIDLKSSTVTENVVINKSDTKELDKVKKKVNNNSIKKIKQINKITKQKKKTKRHGSNEKKSKTIKNTKTKYVSRESHSTRESKSEDSEQPMYQLGEGETLLDFSALAKLKSFNGMDEGSQVSSQIKVETFTKDNPFLNWNCSALSLEEEQNISTGYLDKRISHVITHAENFPDGGTQLLDDMRQYYCYLKHINQLVIDRVRRGKMLMKQLVEEDPEFTQIEFDTDELAEHFSWVKEETEAFEHCMDSICYQWKCLVARLKHKK